ncbi:hypothetical protein IFR05_012985 [Cadophora sp. M221]|nr:hypothetical protein IFR05_012985 [Cadophora sp. M221]
MDSENYVDQEKLKSIYMPEVKALSKERLGIRAAYVHECVVSYIEFFLLKPFTGFGQPFPNVHTDYTLDYALELIEQLTGDKTQAQKIKRSRIQMLNVWKPLPLKGPLVPHLPHRARTYTCTPHIFLPLPTSTNTTTTVQGMASLSFEKWRDVFGESFPDLEKYSTLYKDIHQHPELPCQESRTASVVAGHLESLGYDVQRNVGGHGVIGILRNGDGTAVPLRSELDALPMKESTGLPYASKVKQVDADGRTKWVMHGCGHDMHMASLLGATDLLQKVRDTWSGTLICVFQPNEERLLGAKAMIDDGLFNKIPMPDIVLGQHAVPTKAGTIGTRPGHVLGFLDSLTVRVYGKAPIHQHLS